MAVEVGGGSETRSREPVEDTAYLVGLYREKGHVFYAFPHKRHVLSEFSYAVNSEFLYSSKLGP